jgi:hypothetical protein
MRSGVRSLARAVSVVTFCYHNRGGNWLFGLGIDNLTRHGPEFQPMPLVGLGRKLNATK